MIERGEMTGAGSKVKGLEYWMSLSAETLLQNGKASLSLHKAISPIGGFTWVTGETVHFVLLCKPFSKQLELLQSPKRMRKNP